MTFELHVHTKFSFDSIMEPYDIIRAARKAGLNGIAITDHDTVKGALETARINDDPDFTVIPGVEVATDAGDIIGLFLQNEIISRKAIEVIDEIHERGGLAILPHPYKGHRLTDELIEKVDVIEIFNARCTAEENEKAKKLAEEFNKPASVGSDAHFLREIGTCRVNIKSNDIKIALLKGDAEFITGLNPTYLFHFSQIIRSLKLRTYYKVPVQLYRALRNFLFK